MKPLQAQNAFMLTSHQTHAGKKPERLLPVERAGQILATEGYQAFLDFIAKNKAAHEVRLAEGKL